MTTSDRKSEINELYFIILVDDDIFKFDVPVSNLSLMTIINRFEQLPENILSILLRKFSLCLDVFEQ